MAMKLSVSEKPPSVVPSELSDTAVAREVASLTMRWAVVARELF